MRTLGLFMLAILFPAFTHAAVIITEVMYDYPGTEGSGDHDWVEIYNNGQSTVDLGGSTVRFMERGNNHIITSFNGSSTLLAPGAVAVIANNPTQVKLDFPNIGLLLDSSFSLTGTTTALGIIIDSVNVSPVTYTPIASASNLGNSLQLVSGNWVATTPTPGTYSEGSSDSDSTPPNTSSDSTVTTIQSSSGAPPEYLPIPTLRIITSDVRTVSSGADTAFTAVVYDGRGNKRDDTLIVWSFGDGMRRTGASVYHKYYDPGEYVAIVRATTSDGGDARSEMVMTVKNAGIKIVSVSTRGITLENTDSRMLDLSLWRLSMGGKEFRIPEDTQILAGKTILFPSQIIQLPISDTASLLYPSGEVAFVYPPSLPAKQPFIPVSSYEKVQAVRLEEAPARQAEAIISTKTNIQTHEEAVAAPAATTELAAAGAALLSNETPHTTTPVSDLLRSPWTLSFLGIVALAASAFIFL